MAAPWEKDWSGFTAAPVTTDTAPAAATSADVKPWERDWSANGAASPKQRSDCYLYTSVDYDNYRTEKAFLAGYRDRLRRVLAEAVPGVGGLSLEPEW